MPEISSSLLFFVVICRKTVRAAQHFWHFIAQLLLGTAFLPVFKSGFPKGVVWLSERCSLSFRMVWSGFPYGLVFRMVRSARKWRIAFDRPILGMWMIVSRDVGDCFRECGCLSVACASRCLSLGSNKKVFPLQKNCGNTL